MAAWSSLADAYGAWTTKPRSTRVPDIARNLHIFLHVFVGTHTAKIWGEVTTEVPMLVMVV